MRYLALDIGDKRTGLALGDPVTRLVSPLEVIECPVSAENGELWIRTLARHVERQISKADTLIVGLPLNMDDTEGPQAKRVRALAERLAARTGHTLLFQDERLTSADAEWQLARSGLTRGEKKQRRDALAAATILRDFLASRPPLPSPPTSPTSPPQTP